MPRIEYRSEIYVDHTTAAAYKSSPVVLPGYTSTGLSSATVSLSECSKLLRKLGYIYRRGIRERAGLWRAGCGAHVPDLPNACDGPTRGPYLFTAPTCYGPTKAHFFSSQGQLSLFGCGIGTKIEGSI